MLRLRILSSAVLCLFLSLPCVAQGLVPVIRLSPDEAAKAKQLAQTLNDAKERSTKAKVAWDQFHQSYQSAHPDLRRLRFSDDFRLAVAQVDAFTPWVSQTATIELTAEERKKLDSLHREMTESEQSLKQAEIAMKEFDYQLVVDHVGNLPTGGYSDVTLSSGKQVRIPALWVNGLVFTSDFKSAFPAGF